MEAEKIQEYLEILLNVQKEQYLQNELMSKLINTRDSLGVPKRFNPPKRDKAYGGYKDTMLPASAIGAIVMAVISSFVNFKMIDNNGFFEFVKITFLLALVGFIIGLLIGLIIAAVSQSNRQSEYDNEYNNRMTVYNQKIAQDKQRVYYELQVMQRINREINVLGEQIRDTNEYENRLSDVGLLDSAYQHNIIATASFYQYFKSRRTFSLGYNPATGDTGAYNIYEQEIRMNLIIDKLDIVIKKLDDIATNQRMLYNCLNEANRKLDKLNQNILKAASDINSNANRQAEMQKYRDECNYAEMRYTNWLLRENMIHNW